MKRLSALIVGCLILTLTALPGVYGQKKKDKTDIPDPRDAIKEIPVLLENLKSKEADTRASAAARLGQWAQLKASFATSAVPTLLTLAKSDENAGVREASTRTLGYCNPDPKTAVPVLVAVLKEDKEMKVKIAAAGSLGYFGAEAKEAVPALEEVQAETKGADKKTEKEKIELNKAASTSLRMIAGIKGKK